MLATLPSDKKPPSVDIKRPALIPRYATVGSQEPLRASCSIPAREDTARGGRAPHSSAQPSSPLPGPPGPTLQLLHCGASSTAQWKPRLSTNPGPHIKFQRPFGVCFNRRDGRHADVPNVGSVA